MALTGISFALGLSCGLESDKLYERVEVVDDALIESVELRSALAVELAVGAYWREKAGGQRSGSNRVEKLDNEHKERRGWVWAQLGESPYAVALEPLGRLAKAAKSTLGGPTAEAMAADYASQGWQSDRAAMGALRCLKQGVENGLVTKVVRTPYEPWLDRRSGRRWKAAASTARAGRSRAARA